MKPSKKDSLSTNDGFKRLCLASMSRLVKTELDRLTVEGSEEYTGLQSYADNKYLDWLRKVMSRRVVLHDSQKPHFLDQFYVTSILALFDDNGQDIAAELGENGVYTVDFDGAKPVLMGVIKQSFWLYSLADCTADDFAKNELVDGVWTEPAE